MPFSFYVRRYLLVFAVSTLVISTAQVLKGHSLRLSAPDGALWGAITALVYCLVLAYKLRNSQCLVNDQAPSADP